jgi:preprotein translocase subunit YajC
MFLSEAFANAQNAAVAGPSPASGLIPIILIFVVFYFFMIRPQQKKIKEHQAVLAAVKKGDVVVTSGGIKARVEKVLDGDDLYVKIADNVVITILRSTISKVVTEKISFAAAEKTKINKKSKS